MSSRFAGLELIDDRGRHWVPQPDLLDLAERICVAYIEQRPQFVSGRVVIPKRDLRHFYTAAIMCKADNCTPEQFVYRQLQAMSETGRFWPAGIAKRRVSEKTHQQQWSESLQGYIARLAHYDAMSMIYDPRLLVGDEQLDITPLMRFALASELHMADLMVRYRQAALLEYRASAAAAELFNEWKEVLGV